MLANFTLKRKLEEATSAHDDITPVYLLDEVWNFVNSPSTDINAMLEFVNKRVAHKSPIVKAKALRLIKFLCTKGPSDFKRGLSKSAQPVRELAHYRGEPDPFKGDALNQKVREAAKEALDAVFAPVDTMHTNTHQPAYAARIQGFGSGAQGAASSSASSGPSAATTAGNANWGASAANSSSSGLGSGGSKYVGFGNPRFETQKGPQGGSKSAAQAIMSSKSWATAATAAANAASNLASKGQAALNLNRAGSLIQDQEKTGYSSGEEGSYRGPAALPGGTHVGTQSPLNPSAAANVYTSTPAPEGEEDRLVDSICTPGGLRAQPDKADLQTFVESLGNLDGDKLVELLTHKMDAGPWQATLRAICALEAVIQMGHTEVCGRIAVAFQSEPSALQKAATSPLASLRQHATKVLKLLGIEGTAGSTAAPSTSARRAPAAQAANVPDLMGGFDDEPATHAAPAASAPDMLGDLMGPEPSASGATSSAHGASVQAPAAQGQGMDLFTGLAASQPPSATAQQQQQQQPSAAAPADPFATAHMPAAQPAASSHAHADLMGGFSMPAAAPMTNGLGASSQVQAQPDLFGGMSMAGSQQAPPASPAAALANGNAPGNASASAAADNLAGLFTGLSTDAHGSEAGIPNMAMKAGGRVGSLSSLQGSGSGSMGQAMGARGGSPTPQAGPFSMAPGMHGGMYAAQHQPAMASQSNGGIPHSNAPSPLGMPFQGMGMQHAGQGMQQASLGMQQPGLAMQQPGIGMQQPGMGMLGGLQPQQLQQMQMAQQAQLMQHMAMMQQQQQQQHMGGLSSLGYGSAQQQQHMGGVGMGMGLGNTPGMPGYTSEPHGAIPLDTFSGPSVGMRANSGTTSLGVASSKDFDFVGEHLSSLKRK